MENIIALFFFGKIISAEIAGKINTADFNFPIQTERVETAVINGLDKNEILWLARVIYSETKEPEEMRLVGWVARNRVETKYLGSSYEDVSKSPHQFSGLNFYDAEYKNNISLGYEDTKNGAWKSALAIAEEIYFAPKTARPFPINVRHFYSPRSVKQTPSWASGGIPYSVIKKPTDIHPRFAFYIDIK